MIDDRSFADLAHAYPALARLPRELTAGLRDVTVRVTVPPGHVLFDETGPCTGLPLPVRGCVRVFKRSPEGRELVLYRVRPGDLCVLTIGCLLGHSVYSATGVVEEEVDGFVIPQSVFARLIAGDAGFRDTVLATFAHRLGETMTLVQAVTFQRLDERLAATLLERGDDIRVTHQQLADDLGSVREMVSRLLEGFRAEGIL
ncbi:MAG: Crp/Fnr family transcriptional regulator, partial [Gemmatimonadetes bacterium]|nr:Crp/Fnr family transcriptional regulator [Gemmatimonadota bacterium]